ncbi:hypothetical protein [Bradyrhizobium sp. CCGE-LA001]|uniref:hypothetical protein n=1 Tax=Bradyrhizobium sp. CCGE-LA001 TaxID=1223566 RepID=UPI0002AAE33D|nr:hypothetical protein [Bradyrhizobium sp. CCGE-LA001]AMA55809.1 hypothetical protein BCCGELA001_05695 [Bradyrhizobium sp. CCGE-LA001]
MAYALFKDGEKVSRTFSTAEEALEKADRAGLVEHGDGRPVLENELKIKPCPADPEPHDDADLDWAPDGPASGQ